MFSSIEVKPPASGFHSYSYRSLKTSPPIQHRRQDPQVNGETTLHSQEHPERFTELSREEKGEGGDTGDLGEKKESQKRERAVKPVITFLSKNGY